MNRIKLATRCAKTAANAHSLINECAATLKAALGFVLELRFAKDRTIIFHLVFDFDALHFLARGIIPALNIDVVFVEGVFRQIRILDPANEHE